MKILAALFVWSVLSASNANAVVNLKNGNFYVAYHDLTVNEGSGLRVTRHYNSRSGSRGWFGKGWGTEFETRLFVMPDGLVAVRENGNAHVTIYGEAKPTAVSKAVDRILQALRTKTAINPQQEANLRQQLMDDPLERLKWSERYKLTGALPSVGTRMKGAEFESAMDRFAETSDDKLLKLAFVTGDENQTLLKLKRAYIAAHEENCAKLVRTQEGFERGTCSDTRFADKQNFDRQGRLTSLNIKRNLLSLGYGKSPYPERITDEAGNAIQMKWNDQGFVSQISGVADGRHRVIDYTYAANGDLIESRTHSSANVYNYQYDDRHNLTAIVYSDNKKKLLEYDSTDRVIHITQTDGKQAFFRYETDAQGVTETVYLRQVDGEASEVNRLRYDSKGQLLMNRGIRSIEEYEYHPTLNTVIRSRQDGLDCQFEYTAQGKIMHESCPANDVDNYLNYDTAGNVIKATLTVPPKLRERLKATVLVMQMQYDKQGRAIRIGEQGGGTYVTNSFNGDADTEGSIQFHGIADNDFRARFLFNAKASLVAETIKSMNQRTRINSGYVMVRE